MNLLLSIIGFCLTVRNINAATIIKPRKIEQTANFDELKNGNPAAGFPVPTPYEYLDYSGFAYAAPSRYAIAPSSKPDLIVTPYILSKPKDSTEPTTPLPEGEISIPAESEVTSFDAESVSQACSLALQNGLIIPAIGCTILWTGVKADSSEKDVTFEAEYKPDGVLDLLNLSVGGVKMKKIPFPDNFRGLKSLKPTVLKPKTGVLVQIGFDDFKHTLYFKK